MAEIQAFATTVAASLGAAHHGFGLERERPGGRIRSGAIIVESLPFRRP